MTQTVGEWGFKDAYGANVGGSYDGALRLHVLGAQGEVVAADYLGYTACKGDFAGSDVGPYQVRTRSRIDYDLLLHDSDQDDAKFILVLGPIGEPTPKGGLCFYIVGWLEARFGKKKKYWKDPAIGRPAYFVPQDILNPIEALPEIRSAKRK